MIRITLDLYRVSTGRSTPHYRCRIVVYQQSTAILSVERARLLRYFQGCILPEATSAGGDYFYGRTDLPGSRLCVGDTGKRHAAKRWDLQSPGSSVNQTRAG